MLAAMKREEIEAALEEWVNETAIDPHIGAPFVVGGLEIANYNTFLIGHTPTGDPPTSGRRSHHFDLRFLLTPQETWATSQPMTERLLAVAVNDPEIGGRLTYGTRLDGNPNRNRDDGAERTRRT